jgi:hypothetical protein
MFWLRYAGATIVALGLTACLTDNARDANAPEQPEKHRPAIGGGPRDPYPDWCSAYASPIPPPTGSLPGHPGAAPGLDPCPNEVPPIPPPPPVAPTPQMPPQGR